MKREAENRTRMIIKQILKRKKMVEEKNGSAERRKEEGDRDRVLKGNKREDWL